MSLLGHKGLELLKRTISTSDKVLEQLVDSVKSITVRGCKNVCMYVCMHE